MTGEACGRAGAGVLRDGGDPPATFRPSAFSGGRFCLKSPAHDPKQTPTFMKVMHVTQSTIWTPLNRVISSSQVSLGRRDSASTPDPGVLLLQGEAERQAGWQGRGSAASEAVSPPLPQLDFHWAGGS